MLRECYERLEKRICLPENMEKHKKCVINPTTRNEELLHLHFKHAEDYLLRLEKYEADELIMLSFSAALRKIEQILDEEGWAK